jgi:exopolysaccharide biosynthesis polyprenyl glycosylphosphotransferase
VRVPNRRRSAPARVSGDAAELAEAIGNVSQTPRPDPSAETSWRPRPVIWLRALGDIAAVALAFLISHAFYVAVIEAEILSRLVPPPSVYAGLGLLFGAGVIGFGLITGSYGSGTSVLQFRETRGAVRAVWLTAAFLFASLFILKLGEEFSRLLLSMAVLLSVLLVVVGRRLLAPIVGHVQHSGNRSRRVAIVGGGLTARLVMKKIVQAPSAGLSLVGFVDDYMPLNTRLSCRLRQGQPERFEAPVLGRTWDILEVHRAHNIHVLLLALNDLSRESVDEVVRRAEELGIEVGLVPRLGDLRADQLELEDLTAIPILKRSPIRRHRVQDALKRAVDLGVSVPLLLVSTPLWPLAALAIRLDSRGPVLFRQVRVGKDGEAFVMLKFRTMGVDTDRFAVSPSSESDPRVTRVGRWLRLTGLDEIPQLLNVIRGNMSMVGPRPEMPFLVEGYSELQQTRLLAKPGITGLWQLSPDRDAQIHENIEYDIYYVRHRSLLLDHLILLETGVFTMSILARRLIGSERRARRGDTSVGTVAHAMETAGPSRTPLLLVALDQRVKGGEGSRWRPCLAAARAAAGERSVKVLVAPRNLTVMSRMLSEDVSADDSGEQGAQTNGAGFDDWAFHGRPNGGSGASEPPAVELVPYRGSGEISEWASSVGMVLTDLIHVRDTVMADAARTVVFVDDEGQVSASGADNETADLVVRVLVAELSNGSSATRDSS